MTKYGNRPTVVDGIRFDSLKEARRWGELKLLQRANTISDLKRQVRYPIDVNGIPITHYVADFTYVENGSLVVEDVKSKITAELPLFKVKQHLMKAVHGLEVRVV